MTGQMTQVQPLRLSILHPSLIISYGGKENETLYQRMGEVRDNANLEGLWFRGLAGKEYIRQK